jgi:hypothetical protein
MEQYKYLLIAVFNRPIEEVIRAKPPKKGFMQFGIWKKMTNEQFDCLYSILNTKTLNEDQRYTIFHNSIYIYNSVLKETTRVQYLIKNKEKIKLRRKKYHEANKDKVRLRKKKYREANKDKINARRKTRYWRNKNGRND